MKLGWSWWLDYLARHYGQHSSLKPLVLFRMRHTGWMGWGEVEWNVSWLSECDLFVSYIPL